MCGDVPIKENLARECITHKIQSIGNYILHGQLVNWNEEMSEN